MRSAGTARRRVIRADAGFEALAPLIRDGAMLSTTANPTDGLDSPAMPSASPWETFIP
jgi:hypothetical protein